MKVSINWLKDFVDINESPRDFSEAMTHTGTKVEEFALLAEDISSVVVGKILSVKKHENSDHLNICMVDVGDKTLQIVTGAQNIKAEDLVPVALDGATLPGGKTIKKGKLRGELSEGMLCSLGELELTVNDFPYAVEDGIFILNEECKPGDNIKDVCMLEDTVVDFELTFNRPDCLSVVGIAREAAATFGRELKLPLLNNDKVTGKTIDSALLSVEILNEELCPRYSASVVKNVKIAPSPLWLRARLRAAGVRPINNIVDITNYVMLEYGQPMHAFDYSYIGSKKIVVRNAKDGERIITLDGTEHELKKDMLCIADGEKAVALAGVMGGENSEITDKTQTVVFESANFNRLSIRQTSAALGLRTESSRRYEKGLPPYNTMPALLRALQLVEILGAGEVCEGVIDINNADISPRKVVFEPERINELLGINISAEEMVELLKPLDIYAEGDCLIVPPYRQDLEKTADIAEEVVRLYGFDKIEATNFKLRASAGGLSERQKFDAKLNEILSLAFGYNEIYSYSFISPKEYDKLLLKKDDAKRNSMKLINPLGEDTSVMRTILLPSVLNAAAYNYSRKNEILNLFEHSKVYIKENECINENKELALVSINAGKVDFYDIKGKCEALLGEFNIDDFKIKASEETYFHPTRQAVLYVVTAENEEIQLIKFGQLHPDTAEAYNLPEQTFAAEVDCEKLYICKKELSQYKPLPLYPAVSRDLAFVVDYAALAGELADEIKAGCGKYLENLEIFDVYTGDGIEKGKKSIAYRLTLRAADKTLNDEDADKIINKAVKIAENKFGASLRS